MANAIKWATPASASVATTELNALANAAYAIGAEFDNGTSKSEYGQILVYLGSLTPGAGGYLSLYMVSAMDGTNYDRLVSNNPGVHKLLCTITLDTGASAKYLTTPVFALAPFKTKFVLQNVSGVALASTTNTLTLYHWNDEVQ